MPITITSESPRPIAQNQLEASASPSNRASPPKNAPAIEEPSPFARLVHGLDGEVARGEQMVHSALGSTGTPLDPRALIALQAGVYRYGEAVDLASRLVDRASTAVKTVLQGQ